MPTNAGPPLRKVTLNLYEEDCITLAKHFGHGWSTEVRETIHRRGNLLRQTSVAMRKTLGDLKQ